MKVLDCESVGSTYNSLEEILGVRRQDIDNAFASIGDFDTFYRENPNYPDSPDELLLRTITGTPSPTFSFDRVCWFHLTRTFRSNSFCRGVMPLGQQVNEIWEQLYALLPGTFLKAEWANFRQNMGSSHYAHLYGMKVGDPYHWGPYAVLIRDVAFRAHETRYHDYLHIPEIVEDICMCFEERYSFGLKQAFINSTRPCIVKFWDGESQSSYISPALLYLFDNFHANGFTDMDNTCFDGKARVIPQERLLSIAFLDNVP
jgi:hypothetical protein